MFSILLLHIISYHRIVSRSRCWWKFQTYVRIIHLINFYALYLFKLFNTALHLNCFRWLISKALYKILYVFYFFLLILISAHLLFHSFFAQFLELGVIYRIIIYLAARYFYCTIRYIINKSTVVRHKHHSISLSL